MEIIKNKLMKILLSIAMIISALGLGLVLMPGVAAAAEVTPDGTYTSNDGYYLYTVTDGKAQITKYSAGTETTPLTIPSTLTVTVMGVETTSIVTGLAEKSFSGKYASVTIPEGIVSIGLVPFYSCSSLTSIQVDVNNVNYSSIGGLLYDKAGTTLIECPRSITSVSIPENVTRIGDSAFQGCSKLTGITLPQSITSIGDSTFGGCSALTGITLPQSVISIGDRAFDYCTALTGITLPQSVTSIGDCAFSSCLFLTGIQVDVNNLNYKSIDGALYNSAGTTLVACPAGLTGAFTVLEGVTGIGFGAFEGCWNLTSITLPSSVTSIGDEAFYRCESATSINLPQGVISIGKYGFYMCSNLTSISLPASVTSIAGDTFQLCTNVTTLTVDPANAEYKSINNLLLNKAGTSLIWCSGGLTSVTIPEGVTSIGDYAFSMTNITSISIPEGVTSIGDSAFSLTKLTGSLSIPQSVTSIGYFAFSNSQSAVTSVTFNSATTIIYDDENTIPATAKIIGYNPSTAKDYATKYSRTFEALTTKTVTGVTTLGAINVANGTTLANAGLPSTVQAILSDNSTQAIDVIWDNGSPAYNANTAGTYTFSGTLANLPTGVTNPNSVTATVNVIVAPDDNKPNYTVGIGTLSGGSITASSTTATADTIIELTITPAAGRQLQAGSLKYNDGTDHAITGTSFTMPAANVTVTAVFEQQIPDPALTAGTVTAAPGAVINVPINLTSSGEVVALGFELSYDHSLLTYNQTCLGSGAAGFTIFDFISGNNEAVNLYNMTNTPFPSGTDSTIATMRFTVANAASPGAACVLGLNGIVLSDAQGNEITAKTVNNGQFSIPGQEKQLSA
jgi:Bacterial Ig-like domain (group 4).